MSLQQAGAAAAGAAAVPEGEPLTARPGLLLRAAAAAPLEAAGLADVARLGREPIGDQVKHNWIHEVRRVEVPDLGVVYVKRYRRPPLRLLYRRALWQELAGALREWNNLWTARRLGVGSMDPLGYGETRAADGARLGVLLTAELVAPGTLEDLQFQLLADPPRRRRLARALGELLRRLHDAGWFHQDLYLGHVMVDADDGLHLIDMQRMGRALWPERLRLKDLSQLAYTAFAPYLRPVDLLRAYRAYAPDRDRRRDRRRWRTIAARCERMRRHQARKRWRKRLAAGNWPAVHHDRVRRWLEFDLAPDAPPWLVAGEPPGELETLPCVDGQLTAGEHTLPLPGVADGDLPVRVWRTGARVRRVALGDDALGPDERWRLAQELDALAY